MSGQGINLDVMECRTIWASEVVFAEVHGVNIKA